MANQPAKNTVATSFTLPRALYNALQRKADKEITNQSDIVRRALMNYLPTEEREAVWREISESISKVDLTKAVPVSYKKVRLKKLKEPR